MVNKADVEFLLEAAKHHTTTRQQHQAPETMALQQRDQHQPPLETGVSVRGCYDSEVREQPPETAPKSSPEFDYYGNRISQKRHDSHQFQRHVQQQHYQQDPVTASNHYVVPYQPPAAAQPLPAVEDYSEFLAEPLVDSGQHTQSKKKNDEDYNRGCVAEFGHYLKGSFCCVPDEYDSFLEKDSDLPTEGPNMTTAQEQRAVMKEINDDLAALRQSLISAKTSRAMVEFELRSELASVRRQSADMEEAYRREISREMNKRAMLQAKLQSKLVVMMEERMRLENQLDRLSTEAPKLLLQNGEGPSSSGGSPGNNENDTKISCSTAMVCTNADAPGCLPRTSVLQSGTAAAIAAATDGRDNDPRAVALRIQQSGSHVYSVPQRKGIEPPIQTAVRTPIEPVSYMKNTLGPIGSTPSRLPVVTGNTMAENTDSNSGTHSKDPQNEPAESSVNFSTTLSHRLLAEVSE